jgi:glycosyltransferase involved in cell wall biosynthesis
LRELSRRFDDLCVIDTPFFDSILRPTWRLQPLGIMANREPVISIPLRARVNSLIARQRPDAVVSIGAAHKVFGLHPRWPLVHVTDGLFSTLVHYYREYERLSSRSLRLGESTQAKLLTHTDALMLSSDWAAEAARARYGIAESKIHVVPFGANLDADPGYQQPVTDGPLRLLFVGAFWQRKGGGMALEVFRELRRRSVPVELHIVGGEPPEALGIEGVHVHGQLRKADPAQYRRLVEAYRQCSFLFMPSMEEAFGIVYCEAAAFGRPSIARDTGGVASAVADGVTGVLLPPDAGVADYADRITAVWSDPAAYRTMCENARAAYLSRLNWGSWAERFGQIAQDVLARRAAGGTSPRPARPGGP